MKSLFFASFLFLLAEFSFAEELTNYTITSDSQKNTLKGGLEAIGNVVVKRTKDILKPPQISLLTIMIRKL